LGALHARYGQMPIEALITPAEQMARFGVPVSRALAHDLGVVGAPLLADPGARAVFAPNGLPAGEGAVIAQPDLGATFSQLRDAGLVDMYRGSLARRLQASAASVGGGFGAADLERTVARAEPPIMFADGKDMVGFLPPPAD